MARMPRIRGIASFACPLVLTLAIGAACSGGEKPGTDSAADSGAAAVSAFRSGAPAPRRTCLGGQPTPGQPNGGSFVTMPTPVQQNYIRSLTFVPDQPSADIARVPVRAGSTDSVTLKFEPEQCANYVARNDALRERGRIVGRLTIVQGTEFPQLGMTSAKDTLYWWVGPDSTGTGFWSYFARVGQPQVFHSRELVIGRRERRTTIQDYAEVRLFHYTAHPRPAPQTGQTGAAGASAAMLSRERRLDARLWVKQLALVQGGDGDGIVEPWFACELDCCVSNSNR